MLRRGDLGDPSASIGQIIDLWDNATEAERRKLLDELLAGITVHPDHLQVEIHGAPPINVALAEVGLRDSGLSGVGGPSSPISPDPGWRLQ